MEYCSGGELFERIVKKGHFTEKEAAEVMRSLLSFVAFAHSKARHRHRPPEAEATQQLASSPCPHAHGPC
jgi:calcium-dependent protein kinase